jgi:hypothetical protein
MFHSVGSWVMRDYAPGLMRCLSVFSRGTWSSYLRDALQEGSSDAVAFFPAPRRKLLGGTVSVIIFLLLVVSTDLFLFKYFFHHHLKAT